MKSFHLIAIFTSIVLLTGCKEKEEYQLAWSDEFDYEGQPDSTKWGFQVGGHGWGNSEWQYYTNHKKNAYVSNGLLTITAIRERFEESNYTSARLTTKASGSNWKYGKIEASMKLPFGQGIWPAFWMLGDNIDKVSWPECGEIDIMEMIGGECRENTTHGTLHWKNMEGNHEYKGDYFSLEEGFFSDDFHLFSITWNPDSICWYVDNVQFHSHGIQSEAFSAFHKNHYILLNLAVGGRWPGYPDSTTLFPQKLEVDFVRVFQKRDY